MAGSIRWICSRTRVSAVKILRLSFLEEEHFCPKSRGSQLRFPLRTPSSAKHQRRWSYFGWRRVGRIAWSGCTRSSGEVVAYAGLNPRQHQSGTSVDRATRISKIGNAVLRAALYMPALSALRYNPAIVALVTRLKSRGRLKPKQIVVAAMRKLLVLCFGVLKTGKPFDPAIAMGC